MKTLNDFQANIIEKVSKLERTADDHERRIQSQENQNETLNRLVVLVEVIEKNNEKRDQYQKERDEQQNQQMKEFSDTMKQVNNNLTELNNGHRDLNLRVGNIEEDSRQRWSWDGFFKQAVPAVLIALIIAGISYWIGIK